jgi:hypothetical protein
LHECTAVVAAVGIDFEGGGGSHNGDGGSNGKAHVEEGTGSEVRDWAWFSGLLS